MKDSCTVIATLVGGVILGSALTMCLAPKTSREMRQMAHGKILKYLEHIHQHLVDGKCMIDGSCSVEKTEGDEQPTM